MLVDAAVNQEYLLEDRLKVHFLGARKRISHLIQVHFSRHVTTCYFIRIDFCSLKCCEQFFRSLQRYVIVH